MKNGDLNPTIAAIWKDGDAVLLASKERNDDSGEYAVLHSFKCRLQAQQLESSDTEILGASMRRNKNTHTHTSQ